MLDAFALALTDAKSSNYSKLATFGLLRFVKQLTIN